MQSFMKFKAINIGCLSPRPSCSKGGQFYPPNKSSSSGFPNAYQAPVVEELDSAIQRINLFPVDSAIGLPNTYPLDSD